MPNDSADVIIIGGGVVGCAAAYYLAQGGVEVLLVEQHGIGSGASGRSGGGIRQSARVSEEMPLAMASIALFPGLSDQLGADIEYVQAGNLRLVENPEYVEPMQTDIVRQQALGLDVRWLEAEEVREMVPLLKQGSIFGASYCPTDGHVNPFRLTTGFYQAACRIGAKALIGQEARSIRQTDAGGVIVEVGEQTVQTSTVIIAAGAGSRRLCQNLGFNLPLTNLCHESMVTEALPPLFSQMFGVFPSGLYFRQTRHGGIHFGGGTSEQSDIARTTGKNLQATARRITRLMPELLPVNVLRAWSGIDSHTSDKRPIIDYLNENVILASGFSGHGLAVAPIVGRYLAEWITSGKKPELLAPFGYDRFN